MKILPKYKERIPTSIIERIKKVEPATIGHYLHFGFMAPRIKSALPNVKVVGQAVTVKTTANDGVMVHKAVSLSSEGDVIVIDRSGDPKHACVGEIVAFAAKVKKIAGIIVDGPMTDIQAIKDLDFPVFATGLSPITTKIIGQSGEINTTVHCGGVSVRPGDLILADDNGVLVFPSENIEDMTSILEVAEANDERERSVKERLKSGINLASISKADALLKKNGVI